MKLRTSLLATLLLGACTAVHYESPRLAERPADRDTVAVLPFEMVFTGKAPKDLSAAQILAIEEAESHAFQHSFYNRLLDRSSATRKNPILVRIQPIDATNSILDEEGISIRESWEMPAEELAEILGVDAVIRTTVQKTRYLSDIASYGIDVGLAVLHEATEGETDWLIPPGGWRSVVESGGSSRYRLATTRQRRDRRDHQEALQEVSLPWIKILSTGLRKSPDRPPCRGGRPPLIQGIEI
jgi:hypothetical protein